MRTSHSNETEMSQRFEWHQVKCDAEFTDCSVTVPEIGRHPPATNPCVCQPWINCQRSFESTVGFFEAVRQHESAAAQSQREGIVRCEIISLLGQLTGALSIKFWRRAETVGRALPPAPGADRLWQPVSGRQFLRAAQFLKSDAALLRCNRESIG